MADYKGIKGFKVQSLASDPSPALEGQVWYNTASSVLKYTALVTAWTTGNNCNTARDEVGGAGTQTAGIIYGGSPSPGAFGDVTEEYDGTSWTETADMVNASAGVQGVGTQTAALRIGGYGGPTGAYKTWTEEWNGTSWAAGGALANARGSCAVFGILTAAVGSGGYNPGYSSYTEEYDGSTWSAGTAYPTVFAGGGGGGTATAGLVCGGNGGKTATNHYDGSSWTSSGGLNTGRNYAVMSGGTLPAVMCSAGQTPGGVTAVCEQYDGTSWTEVADINTARKNSATNITNATQTSALVAAGHNGSIRVATTEEFGPGTVSKTVTTS